MANKYSLKWNSHHDDTFHTLQSLKDREMFVDVTLSCNGQLLKAHKIVLCASSSYFERILFRDGGGHPVVHFYGVEPGILQMLLSFMYSGQVEVPSADLEKLINLADNLEVKGLKAEKSKAGKPDVPAALDGSFDAGKHKLASSAFENPNIPQKVPRLNSALGAVASSSSGGLGNASPKFEGSKESAGSPLSGQNSVSDQSSSEQANVKMEDEGEDAAGFEEDPQWEIPADPNFPEGGGNEDQEPEMPRNIPAEVDPQTMVFLRDGIWQATATIGDGSPPFVLYFCGICTYKTRRKGNALFQHALVHFGRERFQCVTCGRKFKWKRSLTAHIFSAHRS